MVSTLLGTAADAVAKKTKPLNGAGWHQWQAWQDGQDVKGTGTATVFGGGDDSGDNSMGYWDNPIGPDVHGVSLPTGRVRATNGSPFPQVPKGTLVKVYNKRTGKSMTVPVIDEGPTMNDQADSGKNGGAMVDIASATAKALGMGDDANDPVDIRILGGSQYLQPGNFSMAKPDPNHVDPTDNATVAKMGSLLPNAISGKASVDTVRDLIPNVKSGALQGLLDRFDAHLDLADNTRKSNPALSKQEFANAQTLYSQMRQKLAQTSQPGPGQAPITPIPNATPGVIGNPTPIPNAVPGQTPQPTPAVAQNLNGALLAGGPAAVAQIQPTPQSGPAGGIMGLPGPSVLPSQANPAASQLSRPTQGSLTGSANSAEPASSQGLPLASVSGPTPTPQTQPASPAPNLPASAQPNSTTPDPSLLLSAHGDPNPVPPTTSITPEFGANLESYPEYKDYQAGQVDVNQKLQNLKDKIKAASTLKIPDTPSERGYTTQDFVKLGLSLVPGLLLGKHGGLAYASGALKGYQASHAQDKDTEDYRAYQQKQAQAQADVQSAQLDYQNASQNQQAISQRLQLHANLQHAATLASAHAKELGDVATGKAYHDLSVAKNSADAKAAGAELVRNGEDPQAISSLVSAMSNSFDAADNAKRGIADKKATVSQLSSMSQAWQRLKASEFQTGQITPERGQYLDLIGRQGILNSQGLLPPAQQWNALNPDQKNAYMDTFLPRSPVGQTVQEQGQPSLQGVRNAQASALSELTPERKKLIAAQINEVGSRIGLQQEQLKHVQQIVKNYDPEFQLKVAQVESVIQARKDAQDMKGLDQLRQAYEAKVKLNDGVMRSVRSKQPRDRAQWDKDAASEYDTAAAAKADAEMELYGSSAMPQVGIPATPGLIQKLGPRQIQPPALPGNGFAPVTPDVSQMQGPIGTGGPSQGGDHAPYGMGPVNHNKMKTVPHSAPKKAVKAKWKKGKDGVYVPG